MHENVYASVRPDLTVSIEGLRWVPVLREIISKKEKVFCCQFFINKEQALHVAETHLRACREGSHESLTFHGHWVESDD